MLRTGAASYAEALRTLAEPGVLPAVYFCMAGKDRTGVFSAVVLGLLGVADDDIVADYVLHARGRRRRSTSAAARETTPTWRPVWPELPERSRSAVPATMQGLLDRGARAATAAGTATRARSASTQRRSTRCGRAADRPAGERPAEASCAQRAWPGRPGAERAESGIGSSSMIDFGLQLPNFTLGVPDGASVREGGRARDRGRGERLRLALGDGPPLPAPGAGRCRAADARGVHVARRARGPHAPRAARHARHGRHVPQPGDARQDRHDARRDLAGGPSSASAPRGTTSSTRRSASTSRPSRSAWTASRRRCRSAGACSPRTRRRSPASTTSSATSATSPARPGRRTADHGRRWGREPHAPARRAVRRHVQRQGRSRHGAPQARRAPRATARTSAATTTPSPRRASARSS